MYGDSMADMDGDAYYAALGSGAYDPDTPTHADINSREAAAEAQARGRIKARRRFICEHLEQDPLTCWDFCEGLLRQAGHGAVSGTINGLWRHGLIQRVGRKTNGRGHHEWIYALNPSMRGHLDEVDWDTDLAAIEGAWGLTPPPAGSPPEAAGRPLTPVSPQQGVSTPADASDRYDSLIDEVAEADITLECSRCKNRARLSQLSSRFGVPQRLTSMGGREVYEVTCPVSTCPSRKRLKHALEAVYMEVKP